MKILPIASGKGGVGKSLIAANLSIALAECGKKVVLVDLDLGGSNLHTILGLRSIDRGLGTFLNSPNKNFDELLIKTDYNGLLFIPGDAEIPEMANLRHGQKRGLIKHLMDLETDFLVIDLGAGTSHNVLDFFLISGQGIIVATPALTSILNAYLFLKNAVFRIMTSAFQKKSPANEYLEKLKKEGKPLQKIYLPRLLSEIEKIDPESYTRFSEKIATFHPCVVLNMLESPKHSEKSMQLRRSIKEYLDLNLEHLGIIYKDDMQKVALNSRLPIIKYKPNSILSTAIYRIADKILQMEYVDGAPLDIMSLDEGYQVAELEAQIDYKTRLNYVDELLHCEDFTKGDLIETVKSQQYEIEKMRKENNLLKTKLLKAINEGFID